MINLLLGSPGSGKSFEAVAYHAIVAIQEGRKVITNLPLLLENLDMAGYDTTLIQMYDSTVKKGTRNIRSFSDISFFNDPWRHPENGTGPLYIIDECHFCFPRGATNREVEEWFSVHRHQYVDVLLITQSYGKVSQSICDLVQIVYRVRKNTALGSDKSYVRKVYDGLRGEQVNQEVRTYDLKKIGIYQKNEDGTNIFYPFYKSNTMSGAGKELSAKDVRPIWKHWSFYGAALMIAILVYMVGIKGVSMNPMSNKIVENMEKEKKAKLEGKTINNAVVLTNSNTQQIAPKKSTDITNKALSNETLPPALQKADHPFAPFQLSLRGYAEGIKKGKKWTHFVIGLFQNGMQVGELSQEEFEKPGYKLEPINYCLGKVTYKGENEFWIYCDAPKVGGGITQPNTNPQTQQHEEEQKPSSFDISSSDPSLQESPKQEQTRKDVNAEIYQRMQAAGANLSNQPMPIQTDSGKASASRNSPESVNIGNGQTTQTKTRCFGSLCQPKQP